MTTPRKTPKEISGASDQEQVDWLATETDPRKIQDLLGIVSHNSNGTLFERCKVSVSILISEQQADSARKLETYTRWLIGFTIGLFLLTAYLCFDAYQNHERVSEGYECASQK